MRVRLPVLGYGRANLVEIALEEVSSVDYSEDYHVVPIYTLGHLGPAYLESRGRTVNATLTFQDGTKLSGVGLEDFLTVCKAAKKAKLKFGRKVTKPIRDLAAYWDFEERVRKRGEREERQRKRKLEQERKAEVLDRKRHPEKWAKIDAEREASEHEYDDWD